MSSNRIFQTVLSGCLLAFMLQGCSPYKGIENSAYKAVNEELKTLQKTGSSDLEIEDNYFAGWNDTQSSLPESLQKSYLKKAIQGWEVTEIQSPNVPNSIDANSQQSDSQSESGAEEAAESKDTGASSEGASQSADSAQSSQSSGSSSSDSNALNNIVVYVTLDSADFSFLEPEALRADYLPWLANKAMTFQDENPDLDQATLEEQVQTAFIDSLGHEIDLAEDQQIPLVFICDKADGHILAIQKVETEDASDSSQ